MWVQCRIIRSPTGNAKKQKLEMSVTVTKGEMTDITPDYQVALGPGYYKHVYLNGVLRKRCITWNQKAILSFQHGFIEADGKRVLTWDPDKDSCHVKESTVMFVTNFFPEASASDKKKKKKKAIKKTAAQDKQPKKRSKRDRTKPGR